MIGRQINFYLTAGDERQLLEAIGQEVGCTLIARDDGSPYHVKSQLERASEDWAVAYLCEPHCSKKVLAHVLSGSPDMSEALAIEFIQPMEEDGVLRRGRFWYSPKRVLEGRFVQKQKHFVEWASAVFRITKRELSCHRNDDWVGQEARSLHESGRVVLVA